jgi:hypothetical protein
VSIIDNFEQFQLLMLLPLLLPLPSANFWPPRPHQ